MKFKNIVLSKFAKTSRMIIENTSLQKMLFNAIRLNRQETDNLVRSPDLQFLAFCLSRRWMSKAQILQDLWVCFELGEKTGGYFVEFGATNGLSNSNTWLLEKRLGWKGILAEPNPVWHAELAGNRTACIEHLCVSSKSDEVVTFLTTNDTDPELSAIATFAGGDHFADLRQKGQRIAIATISLNDLLDKYNAPQEIDYISIDTEGSEFDILSAFDFGKRRFRLLSVEQNMQTGGKIQLLLEGNGYVRVFPNFSQWDGWYVSREMRAAKQPAIAAPKL